MRVLTKKRFSTIILIAIIMLLVMITLFLNCNNFVFAEQNDTIINAHQYVVEDYLENPNLTIAYSSEYTNIEWSSSDEDVATIDNNGVVTIKKYGQTTIKALDVSTGDYDTCNVYSVIKNFDDGTNMYTLRVDGDENYVFAANDGTNLNTVITFFNTYLEKEREYVIRDKYNAKVTYFNITLASVKNDDNFITMNYLYTVTKVVGNIDFNVTKEKAEVNDLVELKNIKAVNTNYDIGKIEVKVANGEDIIINQNDKNFHMPKSDVEVSILVSSVNITLDGNAAYISSKKGLTTNSVISIEKSKQNSLNEIINIPEDRDCLVAYKLNISNYKTGELCEIRFKVPDEMLGRDGTTIITVEDGTCVEKAIMIQDGYMYFTTTDPNDFAIIGTCHAKGANLVPAIIIIMFLNAFATVGIVILSVRWIDNNYQEKRRKNRAYSSVLPIVILLGAGMSVLGRQITALVFYSILLLAKIIVLIWLLVKLTEKGAVWIDE